MAGRPPRGVTGPILGPDHGIQAQKAVDGASSSFPPPPPPRPAPLWQSSFVSATDEWPRPRRPPPQPGLGVPAEMVTPTPAWHLAVGEARASRSPLRLSPTFPDREKEAAGRISPSQEQLGDRGRPGPPSAPGHVPRRCRAVKPLGPQLPSIQWTASGCPPDAGHGGGGSL